MITFFVLVIVDLVLSNNKNTSSDYRNHNQTRIDIPVNEMILKWVWQLAELSKLLFNRVLE